MVRSIRHNRTGTIKELGQHFHMEEAGVMVEVGDEDVEVTMEVVHLGRGGKESRKIKY